MSLEKLLTLLLVGTGILLLIIIIVGVSLIMRGPQSAPTNTIIVNDNVYSIEHVSFEVKCDMEKKLAMAIYENRYEIADDDVAMAVDFDTWCTNVTTN